MEKKKESTAATVKSQMSGDLKDALEMLSTIYFRILKINLTTEAYETLQDNVNDMVEYPELYPTISDRLAAYVEKGFVHEDDKEGYLHFCSIENLRAEMKAHHYTSWRYRRMMSAQYHWVSVEVVRGAEYRPDNEVAVLYVRDINDEYMRQLDFVMRRTVGSVGTVSLRVTGGCVVSALGTLEKLRLTKPNEDLDEYIRRVSTSIPVAKARERFVRMLCRSSLLESYQAGHKTISMDHAVYCERTESYRMYRTTVEMVENPFTGEVEAVLYFNDTTNAFLAEKIPRMIYQRKYESVAIIDVRKETICPELAVTAFKDAGEWEGMEDYGVYMERLMTQKTPPEEWKRLKQKTSLKVIQEKLENQERYSLTIHQLEPDGGKALKRFTYLYLQKDLGMVLAIAEDVTELFGRDVLTGGLNRQGFIREAEKFLNCCTDKTRYAVLFLNIKNFKAVNELFGTEAGDQILKEIYDSLQNSEVEPILTARVEADHFLCLSEFENLNAQKLGTICERKLSRDGKTLHLFARCGIFRVEAEPMSITGMIDRAKLAKRYISDEYVQPFKLYDNSMRNAYVDQAELLAELTEGIANEQFRVYYQPVVDSATGKVISAEALVRWKHPEKGMISPALFVPALEENGHISELDFYVIRKVREFVESRYKEGKPIVPVSMNLSWMDFYDENLMDWIVEQIGTAGIPRDAGRYEITETSYAALSEDRTRILETIRVQGSKILLDDFGSGYSSFGMIQDYNFDILKIDMSFVRKIGTNPKTRTILASMIDMAHKVGLKLVAEGAETKEQADFLRKHGCDYIQGYYYYKPMERDDFIRVLESQAQAG